MKNVFHQALKDLRLLRWLLAVWVLAIVLLHAMLLYTASLASAPPWVGWVSTSAAAMGVAGIPTLIVIAALLVLHDSPVDANAFWLTRPTSASAVLGAKLLVAFAVIVLLPAFAEAVDHLVTGIGLQSLPPYGIPLQIAWVLPVMAFAAVASDLPQFVLVGVAEMVLLMAANAVATAVGLKMAVNTQFEAVLVSATLASACVLVWQYLTRRRTVAAVFLAVMPFVLTLGIDVWPWREPSVLLYPQEKRKAISVALDPEHITYSPSLRLGGRVIEIPLVITGETADMNVDVYATWYGGPTTAWLRRSGLPGRFELKSDLTSVRNSRLRPPASQPRLPDEHQPLAADSVNAGKVARAYASALDGTRLLNAQVSSLASAQPAVGISIEAGDLAHLAGVTGTLHVEFDLSVITHHPYGAFPATAGGSYEFPGTRGTIEAARASVRGIELDLHDVSGASDSRGAYYLLRNRVAGESLLRSGITSWSSWSGSGYVSAYGSWIPAMALPIPSDLMFGWERVRFHGVEYPPVFTSIDEARRWLKDAELVLVPFHFEGRFHVVLELPDFVIEKGLRP